MSAVKRFYHDEIIEQAVIRENNDRHHPASPDRMEELTPTMRKVKHIESLLPSVEKEANEKLKAETGLDYEDRENWTPEDWETFDNYLPF